VNDDPEVLETARRFLESKYGSVEVEFEEVFSYAGGVIEVSGSFRRPQERLKRRFTVKVRAKTMEVLGFGLR